MPRLILVKHSLPLIEAERPRNEWRLSDEGRARAARLAERLRAYDVEGIVSSPEPKALETAQIVGASLALGVETIDALREHDDRDVPFQDEQGFRRSVQEFFARPSEAIFGPETADDAHERFSRGVETLMASRPETTAVVVAHGRVISLFVARRNRVDAYDLWGRLGLPSFVVLAMPGHRLAEVVERV